MAVRVVTQSPPLIRVVGSSSAPVSSPVGPVQSVNVSQSNSVIRVPSSTPSSIEIAPLAKPEVQVSSPVVMPFKAIIYQGPKGDPGIAASGSSVLTESVTVTETQGSALEGITYPQLTDLQEIVRDMLSEFVVPEATITSASIGTVVAGQFIESQDKNFEYGTDVYLNGLSFVIRDITNIYAVNLGVILNPVKFSILRPESQILDYVLFPWQYPEDADWSNFLEEQDVVFNESPVKITKPSDIGLMGVVSEVAYTKSGEDLFVNKFVEPFRVGKYIRCYTSLASDVRGGNIADVLGNTANVYDPSNSSFLSDNLQVDTNELKFEEFIYDFNTEEREIILSFSVGSQSVSDEDRYLIIELPNEFLIEEAAATTAGSGVYSLNNSIVYLGNSFNNPSNDPYLVNSNHVKYYRSRIPGAFDEKIRLDLKIKLDN